MKQSKSLGVLLAIVGVLLFSSKAVLVKLGYQFDVDTVTLLLLRMGFALPFYLTIALINQPKKAAETKDFVWVFLLGLVGYYLASYFDFLGLQFIKAGLERLILFIYPTLVLLISFVFLKKKITSKQILGVLITYVGVCIIFISEFSINENSQVLLGGTLVFFSALTYASYLVGSGWLIPKFGATVFTSYAMIVSCLCVITHFIISQPTNLLELPSQVYWIGFAMAIIATVIPSYLVSYAIKILGANDFSIFGSLGPVSTIILAYIFLDEMLSPLQIAGALVIITGIFLAEKKKTNTRIRG